MIKFNGTYKDHVRPFYSEEPFDYLFYRPLAYGLVRLTYDLPLNPNHFSLLGLGVAILSGYSISLGTLESFVIGGFGILLVGVLDCCDGMIARMKNNNSELGELIDMFVDVLSGICFFTGLFVGIAINDFDCGLTIAAMAEVPTIIIHVSCYNYYKKQFFCAQKGFFYDEENDRKTFEKKMVELIRVKGLLFDMVLINLYLIFLRVQYRFSQPTGYSTQEYINIQKKIMPLWGVISGSSHLTILALLLILNELEAGIPYIVIIGNIWFIFCCYVQGRALKLLEGHS